MPDFYAEVLDQLLASGVLTTEMQMLVVCGGPRDRSVFRSKNFQNVVISNVDPERGSELAPYNWSHQDAECLTFKDESFDFCVVHSGLHHCRSPHRALLEMYRVARKGIVVFEPYDNLATRLGVKLKVGQEYEHASVFQNDLQHGGVGNSAIPNYIYRWTEREIVKTISCYAPQARSDIKFVHKMRIPWAQLRHRKNRTLSSIVWLAQPALKLIELCFPKQSNSFATVILKPRLPQALHPWLRQEGDDVRLDEQWLTARFRARRGHGQKPARMRTS